MGVCHGANGLCLLIRLVCDLMRCFDETYLNLNTGFCVLSLSLIVLF